MNPWDQLISELEESLEYVQCALETDQWDAQEVPVTMPRASELPEPSETQIAQVLALLEEIPATEQRLIAKMKATRAELDQSPTRRQAARRYSGAGALRSN